MLAIVAERLLHRSGRRVAGSWESRWWQLGVLSLIVVTPVVVFGRWISTHATLSNDELYAFAALDSWRSVAAGGMQELTSLHSPWYPSGSLGVGEGSPLLLRMLRALVEGLPTWQTIAVFALVAVTSVRVVSRLRADRGAVSPVALLTACTLVGVVVYPVLLRVSNAVNVGFDFPVVARYSIGFAPLLVWLVLLECRDRPLLTRALAGLAIATPLAVGLAMW
jgi:hypothetical protein